MWDKMKSLYSQYLQERTDDLIIETVHGFATYRFLENEKTVYIVDIYVEPEFRKSGQASHLANLIVKQAKEKGYKMLLGSVVPSTKGSTESLKVLLGYGMQLASSGPDCIYFRKEI